MADHENIDLCHESKTFPTIPRPLRCPPWSPSAENDNRIRREPEALPFTKDELRQMVLEIMG